jgi:hypothetical protein
VAKKGRTFPCKVVGGPGTFATKTEAKRAREKARERLGAVRARDVTVRSFWERWTTDPLFARPKESSDIRRRELTKSFAVRYGDVPIIQVGDETVADWLAGGGRGRVSPGAVFDVQRRGIGEDWSADRPQPVSEARHLTRQGPTRPATTN